MKLITIVTAFAGLTITEIWLLRRKSYFLAAILAAILLLFVLAALPLAD